MNSEKKCMHTKSYQNTASNQNTTSNEKNDTFWMDLFLGSSVHYRTLSLYEEIPGIDSKPYSSLIKQY